MIRNSRTFVIAVFFFFVSCTAQHKRDVAVSITDRKGVEIALLTGSIVKGESGRRYYLRFSGDDRIQFRKIAEEHRGEALVFSLDGIGRCKKVIGNRPSMDMIDVTSLLGAKDDVKTCDTEKEAVDELLGPFRK